ncbi:MAG: YbhB/YbcL family Raf kinase inhibitor-like protein [Planctomycetes bacterium]|nr:YbhB/YbcL family Raf kinase inhibitor-like protein [Planctomycetota bacterium]
MTIKVTSPAFIGGGRIPTKYTGDSPEDISPPLAWTGVPENARELVLICEDPDAPTPEPWVHWVIYKIPATATGLPEGIAKKPRPRQPTGVLQGKNSWPSGQTVGYRGPMPPPRHGTHHYYFRLYALEGHLVAEAGLTKKGLWQEIAEHIVAHGELVGTYER